MNLPVSQFYHVSVDNAEPLSRLWRVTGQQFAWVGDSSYPGGVTNSRWENMYSGDGFWMLEDPSDSAYIYAESQGGEIGRVNRYTHETRAIKPLPEYGEKKLRFNWNTPIQMSPNEKGRSISVRSSCSALATTASRGSAFLPISPPTIRRNRSRRSPAASPSTIPPRRCIPPIYSISESPKNGQIIWVGTDDGNLQITRDGAKTWTNVMGNVPDLAKTSWVSTMEASRFDEATAYATFDRHTFGDMKPYAYKTTDYGKTWTALPVQQNAAFAATPMSSRRTRSIATSCSSAPNLVCGSPSMAVSAGRSTREAIFPPSRCAIS